MEIQKALFIIVDLQVILNGLRKLYYHQKCSGSLFLSHAAKCEHGLTLTNMLKLPLSSATFYQVLDDQSQSVIRLVRVTHQTARTSCYFFVLGSKEIVWIKTYALEDNAGAL